MVFSLRVPVAFNPLLLDSTLDVGDPVEIDVQFLLVPLDVLDEVFLARIVGKVDHEAHAAPGSVVANPSRIDQHYGSLRV